MSQQRSSLAGPADYAVTRRWWVIPAALFLLVFFLLPILHNAVRSLGDLGASQDLLHYYKRIILDEYYRNVLIDTIKVSAITTIASVLLGYPVALYLTRHAGRWQPLIIFLLIAPLLTSIIMRTFGWQLIFARRGVLNTFLAWIGMGRVNILDQPLSVYIGMIHVLVPFMVLSIAPVLQRIGTQLEESAAVLGAPPHRVFLHVTLPLSLEGVLTGSILVFMLANGSFLTMLLLGGGSVVTMPLLIFQQFNVTHNVAFAAAMGNTLLLLSLLCLMIQTHLIRPRKKRS